MNDKLLDSIANDLKIDTLRESLTHTEYRCAVIYSAAALWAKTSTQDQLDNIEIGSRRHVIHVCASFINYALDGESEDVKDFFYNKDHDSEKSPAIKLIDSLIRVRELSETGNNAQYLILSLPIHRIVQITPDLQLTIGSLGMSLENGAKNNELLSGLAFVKKGHSDVFPKLIDNNQWVEDSLSSFKKLPPIRTTESDKDLYFDVDKFGEQRFTTLKPHKNYPFDIVMNETIAGERYYLRTKYGFFLFDDLSVKLKDHNRFMIYLVSKMNRKIVKLHEDHNVMRLSLYMSMPLYEDNLLRHVLWPRRNIDDSGSFFGPLSLKPFILDIMNNLGLEI